MKCCTRTSCARTKIYNCLCSVPTPPFQTLVMGTYFSLSAGRGKKHLAQCTGFCTYVTKCMHRYQGFAVCVITRSTCTDASNDRYGYLAMLSSFLIAGALMEGVLCTNSKSVEVLVRAQVVRVPKKLPCDLLCEWSNPF